MSSSAAFVVPIGLDLGSQNCRVAIDERGIVSNTQGHRWTTAIVAKEEQEEGDSSFVFGDAAARLAHEKVRDVMGTDAAEAYLKYMIQLCVDNAACTADQLKIVVSVPQEAPRVEENPFDKLKETIEKTVKSMIPDKKRRKQEFCVGLITEAAAVCVANKIQGNRLVLVVDGGASGLKLTRVQCINGMFIQKSHQSIDTISGPILLKLLAQHVATQFERQSRIPRGEVWESKKARTKLLKEAERVLLGGGSSSFSFTIDGLYEGVDCHVNVSKPRWDMMTGSLVRPIESKLQEIALDEKIDTVLCAGPWVGLLTATIKKVFPDVSRETVLAEEAVVVGCAMQAALSTKEVELVCTAPTIKVPVSPVSIALPDQQVLIPMGAPLPCRVTHSLSEPTKLVSGEDVLAELNDISEKTEMTIELTVEGQLSIQFPGEALVTI